MTVRVANDFKTETQVAYENLVMDNKAQRDKIRNLEQEIVKLNKGKFYLNSRIILRKLVALKKIFCMQFNIVFDFNTNL